MAVGLGLEVARMIPKNTMLGLLSGAYKLHGGVVRDMGGRIVAHMAVDDRAGLTRRNRVPLTRLLA